MSHQPLRILIVEDNQDHALIVAKELTWDHHRPEYERVETPEAMEEALDNRAWDLIVADYAMPHFTGLDALKLLRDKRLDVPFIMISGTQDEEFAVEAMRAGAQDFIPKHKLYRLSPVAKRELKEAEERRLRRQAESELSKREREFEAIVNNAPVGILCYDESLICSYANPAVQDVLGLSPTRIRDRAIGAADHPADLASELENAVLATLSLGAPQSRQIEYDAPEGRKTLQARLSPIEGEGRIDSVLVVLSDMTERTRYEARLREAKEKAEAANRAKSDFLAVMSHELRTPLNGVLGMLDLALTSDIDEDVRYYLQLSQTSGQRLFSLINDVLDFAKVEEGALALHPSDFDLRLALDFILQPMAMAARGKGLEFFSSVDPGLPQRLLGDEGRLSQVLSNIVGNAIKFTERGQVAVRVSEAAPDPLGGLPLQKGQVRLRFSVIDTGIGVAEKDRDRIFESFSQVDSSYARRYEGSGLGLAISKRLAELMCGRLWVESEPGQGSAFHFTAVFDQSQPCEAEASPAEPQHVAAQLKALVAEDNWINQTLVAELLAKRGYSVGLAGNGHEAIEKLRHERYDLVVMDVRMPMLDGVEATKMIRGGEAPGVDPRIPIVALTAHALEGDRERFLSVGMDDYLAKPIDVEELDRALRRIMAKREDGGQRMK